jgi:FlaA1/EpsC-like NDP-sugar epimerase
LNIAEIIGRSSTLFERDVEAHHDHISDAVCGSRVLVLGGAGSIGKEVTAEIFRRNPAALHVIDISENSLVELVRHLRSTLGYTSGETRFLPLDMGSREAEAFFNSQAAYDYVLNLAALKHVRSEKDEFSLMRMIKVNILDTGDTLRRARASGARKFFAVSTDKAKNPANLMGATKRIMEDVLFVDESITKVSTARFANVAFSDGSLLQGFRQRMMLGQPIAAPLDVRRYFMTGREAGLLCLSALALGESREIFFPKLDSTSQLTSFSDIARRFLASHGYEAVEVTSEDEARGRIGELSRQKRWPCYFTASDTAGEKPFEEFYSETDKTNMNRFQDIGIVMRPIDGVDRVRLDRFLERVAALRSEGIWTKADLIAAIQDACPDLSHLDAERFLDEKM